MATDVVVNRYRPKKFTDVLGQESEVAVARKIVEGKWKPSAVMITGPFGTGKTTMGRLLARALLCESRTPEGEPCGTCQECISMDADNNPNYIEVDAASQGAVADVRAMKDMISYRSSGGKMRILCYDESHMLSAAAQNALLTTLEEGQTGVLFLFATTESEKMLPTIKSRCVEMQMKLLTVGQLTQRLELIAKTEGYKYEDKALRIVATYVKGHARDALIMIEQLSQMADVISEDLVRQYLKLDKNMEVFQFLCEADKKEALTKLEALLCNMAPSTLAQAIGEALVNAYKVNLGFTAFTAVDKAWLEKIVEAKGRENLLPMAEEILSLHTDYSTIAYATAGIGRILLEETATKAPAAKSLRPGAAPVGVAVPVGMRKPGTPAPT